MPDEDDLPVYVSRDLKMPLEEAWPRFKHYNWGRSLSPGFRAGSGRPRATTSSRP